MNLPKIIYAFFLAKRQICISNSGHVNILHGIGNDASFGTQSNSRFNLMTIYEVSFNRPEVVAGFQRPLVSAGLRPIRVFVVLRKDLHFQQIHAASKQYCRAVCDWEDQFVTLSGR